VSLTASTVVPISWYTEYLAIPSLEAHVAKFLSSNPRLNGSVALQILEQAFIFQSKHLDWIISQIGQNLTTWFSPEQLLNIPCPTFVEVLQANKSRTSGSSYFIQYVEAVVNDDIQIKDTEFDGLMELVSLYKNLLGVSDNISLLKLALRFNRPAPSILKSLSFHIGTTKFPILEVVSLPWPVVAELVNLATAKKSGSIAFKQIKEVILALGGNERGEGESEQKLSDDREAGDGGKDSEKEDEGTEEDRGAAEVTLREKRRLLWEMLKPSELTISDLSEALTLPDIPKGDVYHFLALRARQAEEVQTALQLVVVTNELKIQNLEEAVRNVIAQHQKTLQEIWKDPLTATKLSDHLVVESDNDNYGRVDPVCIIFG
jgi:hypothetical protein